MTPSFICEITGTSGLTFFDAFESEAEEMKKVEKTFPESIKEPILRFVQFSTIPRLDVLVDMVYSKFKNDFYPGETCYVRMSDSTKKLGKIKEKARFNAIVNEEGILTPGHCAYRVFIEKENREFTVDESTLSRERALFNKSYLKAFIKLSTTKTIQPGSPWVVREKFVKNYRIPLAYPKDLKQFDPEFIEYQSLSELLKTEDNDNRKRNSAQSELQDSSLEKRSKVQQIEEKPKKGRGRGKSKKIINQDQSNNNNNKKLAKNKPYVIKKFSVADMLNSNSPIEKTPKNSVSPQASNNSTTLHQRQNFYAGPIPPLLSLKNVENIMKNAQLQNWKSYTEVLAPKKSIVDDLDIPINNDYSNYQVDLPNSVSDEFNNFIKPKLNNVSELKYCISECLQTWAFLNVYHNALILDPFTFDDFITCLSCKSQRNINLLNEIFCAVLSCFMLGENEDVNLRVKGYEFSTKDYNESQTTLNNHNNSNNIKLKNGKRNNYDDDEAEEDETYDRDVEDFPVATDGDYENEEYLLIVIPDDYLSEEDVKNKKFNAAASQSTIKKNDEYLEENNVSEEDTTITNTKSPINYGLDFDIYEGVSIVSDNVPTESNTTANVEAPILKNDNEDEVADYEEDDHEIAVEDINNVHKLLNYRNISWQERLHKRNFKDGYWKIIMLGIFSLIRDLEKFRDIVDEIGSILAPKKSSVSPSAVQNNFYNNLSLELKVKALNILCELLVGGRIIRTYIDNSIEEQTKLKRDRQEAIREFKAAMENARDLNAECSTMVLLWKNSKLENQVDLNNDSMPEHQQEPEDGKKRKRRRNFTLRNEATPAEIELSLKDDTFKIKMDERTAAMHKAERWRLTRKNIEKRLVEIDSARIRLIGKDKYFNRYWWFEKNGLPMLGKKSVDFRNIENSSKTANQADEFEEEEEEEVEQETYLMGRLWVQGPSKDESSMILKFLEKDLTNYYSIKYNLEKKVDAKNAINKKSENNKLTLKAAIRNETGITSDDVEGNGIVKDEIPSNSKIASAGESRSTDTNMTSTDFSSDDQKKMDVSNEKLPLSFIISAKEIFDLEFSEDGKVVKDKGGKIIYSSDMKNIANVPPSIAKLIVESDGPPLLSSSDWRYYDSCQQVEALIRSLNPWGRREAELRKELVNLKDAMSSSINARRKALLLDNTPDEESRLMNEINNTCLSASEDEDNELQDDVKLKNKESKFYYYIEEEEEEDTKKIQHRKAKHYMNEPQGDQEDVSKRNSAMSENNRLRVSQRELKRKKLEEHLEKKNNYNSKVKKLEKLQQDRQLARCLEWINSCAIERLGHTHYEGRGKSKYSNGNSGKKIQKRSIK